MPRFSRFSIGLATAAGILLATTAAQAATPAQNRAIRHLAATHAAAWGPPTAIRGSNLTRTMTVVFTLPDDTRRLFFVMPNGRVEGTSYRPVAGDDQSAAPTPDAAPPANTSPPEPEGGKYDDK